MSTVPRAKELSVKRDAAPAAVLLDPNSKVARAYGATTTPHMYIVDPKGTLAYMGAIDDKPSAERGQPRRRQELCPAGRGGAEGRQAGVRGQRPRPMAAR